MAEKIKLEIPVYTVEAALLAEKHGADRLELCADFFEGGTTPSAGLLSFLKTKISIPVFVMIRPRGGDFCYTRDELQVMKRDIGILGDAGADGFVFGVLDSHGKVDDVACKELIAEAGTKPCTFHRAIDVSASLEDSLESIIRCGFSRVLSSGGKNSVGEGLSAIINMLEIAKDDIIVMPGGGMKVKYLEELGATGFLKEIHSSCKGYRDSDSQYFHSEVFLSSDQTGFQKVLTLDPSKLREYKEAIDRL